MGLLKWLWPSKPDFSTRPPTIYSAEIHTTDGDSHICVFFVEYVGVRNRPNPAVIFNDNDFVMPEDATFAITERLTTKIEGKDIPVKYISPVQPYDAGEAQAYRPPEELLGKHIPAVDRRDEFGINVGDIHEGNQAQSIWEKLGRKSKSR